MKAVTIFVMVALLSGCGSIDEHAQGCYAQYYQGTNKMIDAGYWGFIPWLDVPFSAVLDTITLPVDAICIANEEG